MNKKWQIILLVMLIIISIFGIFITLFFNDSRENLDYTVNSKITSIRAIVETIEEENSRNYRNRIKSFINYPDFPTREKIISAFSERDREELLQLTLPFLNIFKKENPSFSTFSWFTPDNHNFLRVHRPISFGDEIGEMRPDIMDANKVQQQNFGYMIGRTGLLYRIVQPVSYKSRHVGVVQFGLKDSLLLDNIHKKLNIPVGIAISNEKFSFITNSKLPSLAGSSHTIQTKEVDLFQQHIREIDWNLDQQKITLEGKPYLIANAFNLLNYKQEQQGYIFVAIDISEQVKKVQSRLIFILLLSCGLLLLSFFILYSSYGSLVQKIINLNQSLEKNNLELEDRVHERTVSLLKSEKQLKSAQQIAPLGHWELDIVTNSVYWSDEIYRIFGLEHQEIKASYEAFLDMVHPDDRNYVNKSYAESVKNKTKYDLEHRIVLEDGEEKWVHEICFTEYDANDRAVRSTGIIHDITEMKSLRGLIPICASCKKIRDDKGYWSQIETYIEKHSSAQFSHAMCVECTDELYGGQDWYEEAKKDGRITVPKFIPESPDT